MPRIKKVTVVLSKAKTKKYEVGKGGIHHIDDRSFEFENSYYLILSCNDLNDNIIHSIENVPVIIDYEIIDIF